MTGLQDWARPIDRIIRGPYWEGERVALAALTNERHSLRAVIGRRIEGADQVITATVMFGDMELGQIVIEEGMFGRFNIRQESRRREIEARLNLRRRAAVA